MVGCGLQGARNIAFTYPPPPSRPSILHTINTGLDGVSIRLETRGSWDILFQESEEKLKGITISSRVPYNYWAYINFTHGQQCICELLWQGFTRFRVTYQCVKSWSSCVSLMHGIFPKRPGGLNVRLRHGTLG